MKKLIRNIILTAILTAGTVAVIGGANALVEWLAQDTGRTVLGLIIGASVAWKLLKAELGE